MPSSTKMWAESFKCAIEDDLTLIECAIKLIVNFSKVLCLVAAPQTGVFPVRSQIFFYDRL
ncbi:MAG: hypothetical protein GQF41_3839 [Candidatus Rifleibacterium amylolyticum]|nr:MAG: hypothetical protein GQF41_3839 [Candidatus Rifleibacterium amylolyticum]